MSMSKNNIKYSEEDEEYAENNDYQYGDSREEGNEITTSDLSMRLPVKLHINKLEQMINDLNNDLEESKRNIQMIRSELLALGHINNDTCQEISRFVMDEAIRISKEFKNIQNIESDETKFLKEQVAYLTQDRIKLQQNTLVLENRVMETEKDVGFLNY